MSAVLKVRQHNDTRKATEASVQYIGQPSILNRSNDPYINEAGKRCFKYKAIVALRKKTSYKASNITYGHHMSPDMY